MTCGRIGHANLRQQRRNTDRFFGPVDKFGLGDFVFDGERVFGGGGVGGVDAGDLAAEAVGDGEESGDVGPFFFGGLVEGDTKEEFVVAAEGVFDFGGKLATLIQ